MINSRHQRMSPKLAHCSAPVLIIFWKRNGGEFLDCEMHLNKLGSCSPDNCLKVQNWYTKIKGKARSNEVVIVTHTKVSKRILESSVLLLSATEGQLEHWSPSSDRRAKPETQKVLQSVLKGSLSIEKNNTSDHTFIKNKEMNGKSRSCSIFIDYPAIFGCW